MTIANKKIIIGFIIAFIVALNVYALIAKNPESPSGSMPPMSRDTPLSFDVDAFHRAVNPHLSSPIDLQKSPITIMTFWATWCPSCKKENILFNTVYDTYKDTVQIIGISVDSQKSDLDDYLNKTPLVFPVVHITPDIASLFEDIIAVPTHFIYIKSANTLQKYVGMIDQNTLRAIQNGGDW